MVKAMAKWTSAVMVAGLCLACRSEDVSRGAYVIIPAEIPSVSSGVLRMSLWAYDPLLADAPASLVDGSSVSFTHRAGEQNVLRMGVHGDVPSGAQHYITVRGYQLLVDGERLILWDGIAGTDEPSAITMRSVNTGPVP